jgi:sulfite exporter TauE/SafE
MNYQEITIIFSLFTFGLLGGFSHCASMCGPFVLTQVGNRLSKIDINQATVFKKLSGLALVPYNLGRITTYCFIGFISSALSTNLRNAVPFKGLAGLILIIAALIIFNSTIAKINLPFRIRGNSGSRHSGNRYPSKSWDLVKQETDKIPAFAAMMRLVRDDGFELIKKFKTLINFLFLNPTGLKNYFLGILLGFIPCGLLYGAIATVVSLDSKTAATLAMLAFGVGTIPSLFLTACGGYWFFDKIQNRLKLFTKIILFINVITLLVMAFGLIFNQI